MKHLKRFNEAKKAPKAKEKKHKYYTQYLGSCVDIDSGEETLLDRYFSDATELSNAVGNPDEGTTGISKKISKDIFEAHVDPKTVAKVLKEDDPLKGKGKLTYWYIAQDRDYEIPLEEAGFFFVYNVDSDIHYFFTSTER